MRMIIIRCQMLSCKVSEQTWCVSFTTSPEGAPSLFRVLCEKGGCSEIASFQPPAFKDSLVGKLLALGLGIRVGRSRRLLVVLLILVNRILAFGTLQLDGDLHRRLIYFVVFSKSLKTGGQYLHSQLAVGDAVKAGLALRVRLELQAPAILLAMLVHRMHHHARVAYRLSIVVLQHHHLQQGDRLTVMGLLVAGVRYQGCSRKPNRPRNRYRPRNLFHGQHLSSAHARTPT